MSPTRTTTGDGASGAPLRLVVNLNRCEAYAQCCFLAPSVFELHGEEALWYDPSPRDGERDRVLRAAASCPVQAITVDAPVRTRR
jgi:ferredoxin